MRRRLFVCGLGLALGLVSAVGFGEIDIIVDARPGTLVLSSETGDFEVLGPGPERLGITEVEEAGELTAIPNIKLGVGYSSDKVFADVTGEAGILVNERFRSLAYGVDFSAEYRFRKNVAFGPHLGLLYFPDPEWTGDAKIELDKTSGILGGLQVCIGYDVLFVFTIDYLLADPMDVTVTDARWEPSADEIDIEGLAVQFGIRGRL